MITQYNIDFIISKRVKQVFMIATDHGKINFGMFRTETGSCILELTSAVADEIADTETRMILITYSSYFPFQLIRILDHDRPLILNNRDLEVVKRISPHSMG